MENIEVHLEDEDKVILLLCALLKSFESFKDTMLYGKEGTLTLEEVQAALRTKGLTKSKDLRADENGEGLSVQEGMVEVEVSGERVVASQSFSALIVTRCVTSRRIV